MIGGEQQFLMFCHLSLLGFSSLSSFFSFLPFHYSIIVMIITVTSVIRLLLLEDICLLTFTLPLQDGVSNDLVVSWG